MTVLVSIAVAAALAAAPRGPGVEVTRPDPSRPADLVYEIELRTRPRREVHVTLQAIGSDTGSTALVCSPDWGGASGGQGLADVRVEVEGGTDVLVEHPEPHVWRVQHAPAARLRVSYHLPGNDFQDQVSREHRNPILNDRIFHSAATLFLLRPAHLSGEEPLLIDVTPRGFAESGWRVACSFGIDPGAFRVALEPERFFNSVFLAGELRIERREILGESLYVAIQDEDWGFDAADFADLVAGIVEQQREFFDDHDTPFYLVTMIPVGRIDPDSRSIGGSGLTQSFMLDVQRGLSLEPGTEDRLSLVKLLAHEMFHHWNGTVLARAEPSLAATWFSEGFTDFYARRLLIRGSWIDLPEYARLLNEMLRKNYTSPVRNEPNQRIAEEFWSDAAIQQLPYYRGDLAAVLVDAGIRRHSGGERDLDDLMRHLVDQARDAGFRFTTEAFLAALPEWTGAEVMPVIEGLTLEGAVPVLPADAFAPCLEGHLEESGVFDLGFDLDASIREGVVRGVREGGAADRAGLRDGQKMVGWSVRHDDPDQEALVQIEEGNRRRDLRFLPRGDSVEVILFRAVEGCESEVL